MVTKCANHECANEFHYLRNGRLFIVEVDDRSHWLALGAQPAGERKKPHRIEHYWLCDECAPRLTLVIDRERGVVAIPTGTAVARRAAAS